MRWIKALVTTFLCFKIKVDSDQFWCTLSEKMTLWLISVWRLNKIVQFQQKTIKTERQFILRYLTRCIDNNPFEHFRLASKYICYYAISFRFCPGKSFYFMKMSMKIGNIYTTVFRVYRFNPENRCFND
jgi:hypothetical protein